MGRDKQNGQKTQVLLLSRKQRAQELEHVEIEMENKKEQLCEVSGSVAG